MNLIKKVIIITFIFFSFLVLKAQGNESYDIEPFIKAFNETNAVLDNYYLHFGTTYESLGDDQLLLQEGKELSEAFMLPKSYSLNTVNNKVVYQVVGTWGDNTKVELILKKMNEQTNETYLLFRVVGSNSLDNLEANYIKLTEILQKRQISPQINACIQGLYNDKLNNTEQFVLINNILNDFNATKVEMLNTDLVKSVSAFSNQLNHFIWTNENKMNVQVATHFDNLHKKTVLTMGTPIITIEY